MDRETLEIAVENNGTVDARNLSVAADLLAGQCESVSVSGPTPSAQSGSRVRFALLPILAPRARATYRISTRSPDGSGKDCHARRVLVETTIANHRQRIIRKPVISGTGLNGITIDVASPRLVPVVIRNDTGEWRPDLVLRRVEWCIPRRYREGFLSDLAEDLDACQRAGARKRKLWGIVAAQVGFMIFAAALAWLRDWVSPPSKPT